MKGQRGQHLAGAATGGGTEMQVPKKVHEGLEAVRESGKTNMFITPQVIRWALALGYPETAQWIESHRNEYWVGVFEGFSCES